MRARVLFCLAALALGGLLPTPSHAANPTAIATARRPVRPTAGPPAGPTPRPCAVPTAFQWISSPPLLGPRNDDAHDLLSIKDPSVVFFGDRWHVYATTASNAGRWSLTYVNFTQWTEAASAPQHPLDRNPGLAGYHAAPQVFFFRPHGKWYLIFQSQQPQYSTADDLSRPETWSTPRDFFQGKPSSVVEGWIDYWVICDAVNCHLFFTDDAGRLYRSHTSIARFPEGMNAPVVVMRDTWNNLFEGSATYKLKGQDKYLTLIEAFGPIGERYYRSFTADRLEGPWVPLADRWDNPFAGRLNVSFDGSPWTEDVSHGELVRDGHDETLTVDPCHLRFVYQGVEPARKRVDYVRIPYRIGLLTAIQ